MTSVPLPVVETGPEALFRLGPIHLAGDVVHGSMPAGPWLAPASAGCLGVLVDNVLGYAIIDRRPPEHWSVSTEIALDLLEPVPERGELHATATVVHADATGGFATGEVRDAGGRLLARCTQRGRFVPAAGDPEAVAFVVPDGEVRSLLGVERRGSDLVVRVSELLENPMHNLHGGITLTLAELAATTALGDPGLATASIHARYVRAVPGGSLLELGTEVRHRGRTLAVVDVTGRVDGRPCTLSTVTFHPQAAG